MKPAEQRCDSKFNGDDWSRLEELSGIRESDIDVDLRAQASGGDEGVAGIVYARFGGLY